jgi:ribose transport system ATP-binding protein
MDEPTSALTEPEVERLFSVIEDLKRQGCGIIYISHKMEEIYRIADRITVLRDGNYIGTSDKEGLPRQELSDGWWDAPSPSRKHHPRKNAVKLP